MNSSDAPGNRRGQGVDQLHRLHLQDGASLLHGVADRDKYLRDHAMQWRIDDVTTQAMRARRARQIDLQFDRGADRHAVARDPNEIAVAVDDKRRLPPGVGQYHTAAVAGYRAERDGGFVHDGLDTVTGDANLPLTFTVF